MTRNCIHCRRGDVPFDSPDSVCGSCAVLLRDLGDSIVEPPSKPIPMLPGDARIHHKPRRDGKWLAWAAVKRGTTRWFHDYGAKFGFPRDIRDWTAGMVERAVQAIQLDKPKG